MERWETYNIEGEYFAKGDPKLDEVKGVNLFVDMNRAILASGQDMKGIVDYYWPKPGSEPNTGYLKTSVVKLFPEWGWVVGTGEYIDNIETQVAADLEPVIADMRQSQIIQISAVMIVALIMAIIGWAVTSILKRHIANNVKRMESMAVEGEVDFEIPAEQLQRGDELGQIAQACSALSVSLSQRCDLAGAIAEGDLSKEVGINGDRDRLGLALQSMVEGLRSRIDILDREAKGLSSSANEITHASDGLSRGASDLPPAPKKSVPPFLR